jgi:hypothetical protein
MSTLPVGLADHSLFTWPVTYTHVMFATTSCPEQANMDGSGALGVGSGGVGAGSGELGGESPDELTTKSQCRARWCLFHLSPRLSVRAEYKVYFALGGTSVLLDIRDMPVAASFGMRDGDGGVLVGRARWVVGRWAAADGHSANPDRMWMPLLRRSR